MRAASHHGSLNLINIHAVDDADEPGVPVDLPPPPTATTATLAPAATQATAPTTTLTTPPPATVGTLTTPTTAGTQATATTATLATPPPAAASPTTSAGDNLCVICLVQARSKRALVPCGHTSFCDSCIVQLQAGDGRCALCRREILMVVRLY